MADLRLRSGGGTIAAALQKNWQEQQLQQIQQKEQHLQWLQRGEASRVPVAPIRPPPDAQQRSVSRRTRKAATSRPKQGYSHGRQVDSNSVANADQVMVEIPEDLLRRIEMLQQRNSGLARQQDMMLQLAGRSGSGSTTSSAWPPAEVTYSPEGDVSFMQPPTVELARAQPVQTVVNGHHQQLAVDEENKIQELQLLNRLLGYHNGCHKHDAYRWPSVSPSATTSPRSADDAPLSQRLRQFVTILRHHEQQTAEDVLQDSLREPLDRFQRMLTKLTKDQRRMKLDHKSQLQRLQAEGAKQEEQHKEQVLQMEQAMLEQSVQREQELAGQLQDLEREWEDVETADTQVRLQAAQVWEQTLSLASAAQRKASQAEPELRESVQGRTSQTERRSPGISSSGESQTATPASPRFTHQADSTQLQQPYAASPSVVVPPGLPRVYEAAVALVLEHGWHALHGGENSGPAWTALHWAALQGRSDVCEVLLQAGADPCHSDEMGKTPLDYAVAHKRQSTVTLLRGAQSVMRQPSPGLTTFQSYVGSNGVTARGPSSSTPWSSSASPYQDAYGSLWAGAEQRV